MTRMMRIDLNSRGCETPWLVTLTVLLLGCGGCGSEHERAIPQEAGALQVTIEDDSTPPRIELENELRALQSEHPAEVAHAVDVLIPFLDRWRPSNALAAKIASRLVAMHAGQSGPERCLILALIARVRLEPESCAALVEAVRAQPRACEAERYAELLVRAKCDRASMRAFLEIVVHQGLRVSSMYSASLVTGCLDLLADDVILRGARSVHASVRWGIVVGLRGGCAIGTRATVCSAVALQASADEDSTIRLAAVELLGDLSDRGESLAELERLRDQDPDEGVRTRARALLARKAVVR